MLILQYKRKTICSTQYTNRFIIDTMATEVITGLVGLFCTIISSVVTFFLTRRKYNTEVESQQIQNMNEAFTLYKKMMEDNLSYQKKVMEETIDSQNKKIESLQKENDALRKQVSQLQMQLISYFGKEFNKDTNEVTPSL